MAPLTLLWGREKARNSICFVLEGVTSPSLPPSTVSFSISLSAVRCWLNQVRDGRCRNGSITDENDNASTLFGDWDAPIRFLHQANMSLCNLWGEKKRERPVNVWCRCARIIGKGKHGLKTYKQWILKKMLLTRENFVIQMPSDLQAERRQKVIKRFAVSGFTWCNCGIYQFVIQMKSDTMSTDSLDIKDVSVCLSVARVCSFTRDTFLHPFSTVCSRYTWIRLYHFPE